MSTYLRVSTTRAQTVGCIILFMFTTIHHQFRHHPHPLEFDLNLIPSLSLLFKICNERLSFPISSCRPYTVRISTGPLSFNTLSMTMKSVMRNNIRIIIPNYINGKCNNRFSKMTCRFVMAARLRKLGSP